MGKKKPTELELMEEKYYELTEQLKKYRVEYIDIQEQYPPESEYLIERMKRLDSLLSVLKVEVLEVKKRLDEMYEAQKKVKRKWYHLSRISG